MTFLSRVIHFLFDLKIRHQKFIMHSFIQSFSHKNINYAPNFSNFRKKYEKKGTKKPFQASKYLPKKNKNFLQTF